MDEHAPDRRKVILVGPTSPPYTGMAAAFNTLVEGMRERRIAHDVVDLTRTGTLQGVSLGRVVQYVRILSAYLGSMASGRGTVYITIAQSRQGFFRDMVMIHIASVFGHRVVLHLHGGAYDRFYEEQPPWLRKLIRSTLLKADSVLVLSERLKKMFDFEPALESRLRVVQNGLPFGAAGRAARQTKRLPGPGEPIRILYLSNLIESKGYLDLLEAVSILTGRHGLNVICDFCGLFLPHRDDRRLKGADGRKVFDEFVKNNRLEKIAVYRGPVTGDGKRELLEKAHFFVLPTGYDNEGQPISIIEAMAHGCVIVSTDYRAIPDMVEDGATGRLVARGNPEAIADAIREISSDPERYEKMSAAAMRLYEAKFTREAYIDRLIPAIVN